MDGVDLLGRLEAAAKAGDEETVLHVLGCCATEDLDDENVGRILCENQMNQAAKMYAGLAAGYYASVLEHAGLTGNVELVSWILQTRGSVEGIFDTALTYACAGGHRELVDWLDENAGAPLDYDTALSNASSNGHWDLAVLCVQRGATDIRDAVYTALSWGFPEEAAALREAAARMPPK